MTTWNRGWSVVVLAFAPAAWADENCPVGQSTIGTLSGNVIFSPNSTTWSLTSGTATLQPANCNKKTSFRATPVSSSSTDGTGNASVSSAQFPYQLQQFSGASWVTWGNVQNTNSSNGVVVNGNNTDAVNTRIIAGNSAPSFPRAGTYTDIVNISRDEINGSGVVQTTGIETLAPSVSIAVPFQCVLTWTNGDSTLVLNYTSFGSASSDTIELNIRCNDTYQIGLANTDNPPSFLSLGGNALGVAYTLTLSGNAANNPPELNPPASTRTITANAIPNQAGAAGVNCVQASQIPGGCAQWSQTQTYYVVISQ